MNKVQNFLNEVELASSKFTGFQVKKQILTIRDKVKILDASRDRKAFGMAKQGLNWLENCQRLCCRKFLNEEAIQASMRNFLYGRKLDRDLGVRFEHLLSRLKVDAEELFSVEAFDLEKASQVYLFLYRELDSIKDQFLLREKKRHSLEAQRYLAGLRSWNEPSSNAGRVKNIGRLQKKQQEAAARIVNNLSNESTSVAV